MANTNLQGAKAAKNDEFYTQYHDIEVEMNAYLITAATRLRMMLTDGFIRRG